MDALAFQLTLNSDTIKLPDVTRFIGKNVIITIAEVEVNKPKEKKWSHAGTVNLGDKLDSVNIRDFAHE